MKYVCMELVQMPGIIRALDTAGLVLLHQGINVHNAEYAHFQLIVS